MLLRDVKLCNVRLNERNLCPGPQRAEKWTEQGASMVLIVYNPSIYQMEEVTFTLPYATFTI